VAGMNFLCGFSGGAAERMDVCRSALANLVHSDECHNEILSENDTYILSVTRSYEGYPGEVIEDDDFYIYLEGRIYGQDKEAIKQQLLALSDTLFSDSKDAEDVLRDWLLDTDGEFVVFIQHKQSGRIVIVNDVFSRLPFYIYRSGNELIISRDLRFISSLIDEKKFDRMAIAQYLLFGFSLGERTFLEGVDRIAGASLIRIDVKDASVSREVVYQFNFDEKKYKYRTAEKNAGELAKLFTRACKNRFEPDSQNILSLSGGLDSRAVGSGFKYNKLPFVAASFLESRRISQLDVNTAKEVAETFGVKWNSFEIKRGTGKEVLKLLRIKNGFDYLGTPHLLLFWDMLKKKYGPKIAFFTGNGGDRIARDITATRRLASQEDLINYIMTKDSPNLTGIPIEEVAVLTGISESKIIEELKNRIESYPEKKFIQKHVHHNIYGQSFKWHHEGDDRKRHFFWSTSPFWNVHFFRYAMNCPDKQKKNMYLYMKFLSKIHKPATEVGYANNRAKTQTPITKNKSFGWQLLRTIYKWPNPIRFVYRQIKKLFVAPPKKTIHSFEHSPNVLSCMSRQLENCSVIGEYISKQGLEDVIGNSSRYNPRSLACVFTITSIIEDLVCKKSSIENYLELEMDSYA